MTGVSWWMKKKPLSCCTTSGNRYVALMGLMDVAIFSKYGPALTDLSSVWWRITASGWRSSAWGWETPTSLCIQWQTNRVSRRRQSYVFSCAGPGSLRTFPSSSWGTRVTWCGPEKWQQTVSYLYLNGLTHCISVYIIMFDLMAQLFH